MQRVESLSDEMNGVITYFLGDGKFVRLDADEVRDIGLARCLAAAGVETGSPDRVPVYQDDREIGSLPWDFDPQVTRAYFPIYDIRPGDFTRVGNRWLAHSSIGPGDFEVIPGFRWAVRS